jgi:choline dehydrogenase-like flavoprotein
MRTTPGALETDTWGRLPGLDRVHLVDSSVFPSVPGTSITLTIMANAHRIADAAAQL